jgi:hypothetical protein
LATLFSFLPFVRPLLEGDPGSASFLLSVFASAFGSWFGYMFVTAAVSTALSDLSAGVPVSAARSLRAVWQRRGPLLELYGLLVALILVSFVLLPLALLGIFLLVRFVFAPQVVMVEDHRVRRSMRGSWKLTRRRFFHTALTLGLVLLAVKLVSTALGLVVLILLKPSFWVLTPLIVVMDALLTPVAAICATYLYGDARAQRESIGAAAPAEDEPAGEPLTPA